MKTFICIFALVACAMAQNDLLLKSSRQFEANFLNEVYKKNVGKNVVMSAFSVLPPLGQLATASVGPSHDELLKAIGFPNDQAVTEAFSSLTRNLKSIPGVEFSLANRIYIKKDAQLNEQYAVTSRDVFNSDVKNIDFTNSASAANEINAWVEANTNNKIKNLVSPDSLDATTAAVLVNALYFKGKWKTPFKNELTSDRDFHVSKEQVIKVPTMQQTSNFQYGESKELDAKLLILPYHEDAASLLVVLPNQIDGINNLIAKLNQDVEALPKAVAETSSQEVNVQLPKFKIETTTPLAEVLQAIGIKKLFSPGEAHLDKLLKETSDLYIGSAIQKAFIEVNEEGAEAAAANAWIMVGSAGPNYQPKIKEFHANRPFYYQLLVPKSSLVLFSGLVTGP